MGIRISKEIGFFIPIEKYDGFIVKNLEDVLEDIDENGESYIDNMITAYKNYRPEGKSDYEGSFLKILANQYSKEKEKFSAYNFVKDVYFHDDVVGLMVTTPELYKKRRYDDLIDYYESDLHNPECTIKYLNQPIYPSQGYIYTGGLEEKFPKLEVGSLNNMFDIKCIYLEGARKVQEDKLNEFVCNSGSFRPNIDAAAFIIAKTFGVLEKGIGELDFYKKMEPVIITNWG